MQNYAFTDMFKNDWMKNDWLKNSPDFNQLFSSQRRNMEALTEANQVMIEGVQALSRAGSETFRANMETMMKSSKGVLSSNTPEAGLAKQAEVTRSIFENTLANMREMTEVVTKCGFEAFEVLNRRATETVQEVSKPHHTSKKK